MAKEGDLISRRADLKLIADYDLSMGQVVKGIHALPSVETNGEWERISGGSFIDVYRCSKCKHEPPKKPLPDIKTWGWDFTNYCPNCGAKMERGE